MVRGELKTTAPSAAVMPVTIRPIAPENSPVTLAPAIGEPAPSTTTTRTRARMILLPMTEAVMADTRIVGGGGASTVIVTDLDAVPPSLSTTVSVAVCVPADVKTVDAVMVDAVAPLLNAH